MLKTNLRTHGFQSIILSPSFCPPFASSGEAAVSHPTGLHPVDRLESRASEKAIVPIADFQGLLPSKNVYSSSLPTRGLKTGINTVGEFERDEFTGQETHATFRRSSEI